MNQSGALDPELAQLQQPMQLWTDTFKAYKATLRPALCLSLGGIAIPLFVLHIYFDQMALRLAPRSGFLTDLQPAAGDSYFSLLFSNLISFLGQYVGGFLLVSLIALSAYFSIIVFAIHFNGKGRVLSFKEAVKTGSFAFIKRGLFAFVLSLFIFSVLARMAQFLVIIAVIACSMVPVLILSERLSGWRALGAALGFRYARIGQRLHLTVVFRVLSLGIFLYAVFGLGTFLAENFLQFDRTLPMSRKLWLYSFGDIQLPVFYTLVDFALVVTIALTLHFYAILTTVLLHHINLIKNRIVKYV